MAISKSIGTQYGVPATYWTMTKFTIDRVRFSVSIELNGYADQQAEMDKKSPLAQRSFNINFVESILDKDESLDGNEMVYPLQDIPQQLITPELIGLFQSISQFGYGLVKISTDFTGSEDL